jgi:hypothetical protein
MFAYGLPDAEPVTDTAPDSVVARGGAMSGAKLTPSAMPAASPMATDSAAIDPASSHGCAYLVRVTVVLVVIVSLRSLAPGNRRCRAVLLYVYTITQCVKGVIQFGRSLRRDATRSVV